MKSCNHTFTIAATPCTTANANRNRTAARARTGQTGGYAVTAITTTATNALCDYTGRMITKCRYRTDGIKCDCSQCVTPTTITSPSAISTDTH